MAVQAMAGRAKALTGKSGVQPPAVETTIGCGRDAGISGSRAAALLVRDPTGGRRLAFLRNAKNAILRLEEI